jgi:hypothetical protein
VVPQSSGIGLESEVTNLANAIAQGDFSPALRRALADRERLIGEITTKLLEANPDSLRSKLRNIRSFVMTRMQDLRAVLNSDVGHVRAELAKHIDQITLTPTGDAYVASGTWNFVGRGSIGGAGGQDGTMLPRSLTLKSRSKSRSQHEPAGDGAVWKPAAADACKYPVWKSHWIANKKLTSRPSLRSSVRG